ncbi:glycosyltransferase family 39 protein [Dyadobacter chenwenxiniae]|uniref:Glycosyltransferase family 39 protein n=1 Tax=Dyadobacter chenwenxiniae TaxID=2906456 RepID=A0A9X1PMZ0_9BACT|nr:glycosyltransferase family 39 protein [Dyadobacter chenwenxiniae]MCF0062538.1 glycosyltransferase family 39 protein [Dyadobacter chenwenxiniae]UON83718.1 glycosyltransferase family 39 protein [Dyadobacter chenwenxiniae]
MPKKTLILCLFILIKFTLHYVIIAPEYDLHRDEYLHLDQGKHLAWGYLSVPPFTSWVSYIISLLGNAEFWVKFFPALFGAFTLVVVWRAIETLGGGLFALVLGATAITFSVLLRINMLYQPNSADILGWTLLYFTILLWLKTEQNKWLYMAAVVFGFSFLNKYNILFLVAGLVPALLVTKNYKIFKNSALYMAVFVAFLIIFPNLIWQYQNNFPVVHHMKLLAESQLVNVNRLDFLKEQILYFLSSIFVLIAAFISFFAYPGFRKYQVFFWSLVFTLSLFTYLRAKGYYAIGLYPIFIAFGAVYLEYVFQKRLTWLRPVSLLVVLALFIPIFRVAFPIRSPSEIAKNAKPYQKLGLLRWEDGKDHELPQDFADMLGWKELAQKVDAEYAKIDDKKHTVVLCDNYGQAGAINYYSRYKDLQAVTMNADYINWVPLDEEIKHLILIQNADDDDPERNKEKPLFRTIHRTGRIENPYAREHGASIYVLLHAKVSINAILKSDIEANRWD